MGCSESKFNKEHESNGTFVNGSFESHNKIVNKTLNLGKENNSNDESDSSSSTERKAENKTNVYNQDIISASDDITCQSPCFSKSKNEVLANNKDVITKDVSQPNSVTLQPPIKKLPPKKIISSTPIKTKSKPRLTDKFVEFLKNGGSLNTVIHNHIVPKDWDELQANKFPIGLVATEYDGNPCVSIIIHMDDSDDHVKRQFLAFFNLTMKTFSPEEFSDWCSKMMMHNTMADYLSLYYLSTYFGMGFIILNAIKKYPDAIAIEMSDRFMSSRGIVRAVRFIAKTRKQAVIMFKNYLISMSPRLLKKTTVGLYYPSLTALTKNE